MADRPISWRVSSFSGQGSSCVEVRNDLCALRDSKDLNGPTLHAPGLRDLVRRVKSLRR
jgi:Domain of unknown function (DUF397)